MLNVNSLFNVHIAVSPFNEGWWWFMDQIKTERERKKYAWAIYVLYNVLKCAYHRFASTMYSISTLIRCIEKLKRCGMIYFLFALLFMAFNHLALKKKYKK